MKKYKYKLKQQVFIWNTDDEEIETTIKKRKIENQKCYYQSKDNSNWYLEELLHCTKGEVVYHDIVSIITAEEYDIGPTCTSSYGCELINKLLDSNVEIIKEEDKLVEIKQKIIERLQLEIEILDDIARETRDRKEIEIHQYLYEIGCLTNDESLIQSNFIYAIID